MFDILDTGGVPVPTADAAAPVTAAEAAPLGQLLRERGLITEEQLHTGLAQHEWSGRPLGEVLVTLGFVSESTIAQALATQHGGLLETEYGYATGFTMSLEAGPTAAPPVSPQAHVHAPLTTVLTAAPEPEPEPAAATVIPLHQTADDVPLAANPALEAAQAEVTAARARIVELEGEFAAALARSGEEGARVAELEVELQRERDRADAAVARSAELDQEIAKSRDERASAEHARIAELEQAVAKARDERSSAANAAYEVAQAHVSAADARVAELEQELAAAQQDASALRAEYERQAVELDATRNELAERHGELAATVEALRAAYARLQLIESAPQPAAPPVVPQEPPAREPGQRQATFPWQS